MIRHSLPSFISGIDVVLSTHSKTYTLSLNHGTVTIVGMGDLHDSKFDSYAQVSNIQLLSKDAGSTEATQYTITVYPTTRLVDDYLSDTPKNSTILIVSVICCTAIIFIVYDYLVRARLISSIFYYLLLRLKISLLFPLEKFH